MKSLESKNQRRTSMTSKALSSRLLLGLVVVASTFNVFMFGWLDQKLEAFRRRPDCMVNWPGCLDAADRIGLNGYVLLWVLVDVLLAVALITVFMNWTVRRKEAKTG